MLYGRKAIPLPRVICDTVLKVGIVLVCGHIGGIYVIAYVGKLNTLLGVLYENVLSV